MKDKSWEDREPWKIFKREKLQWDWVYTWRIIIDKLRWWKCVEFTYIKDGIEPIGNFLLSIKSLEKWFLTK